MKRHATATVLASLTLFACSQLGAQRASETMVYPQAKTVDQTDDYHGTKVADPYRWLEEYSEDTNRWIDQEEAMARKYLDAIPQRPAVRSMIEKLWNYERFGLPERADSNYFFTINNGLQNQSVLFVANSPKASGRVLLDPNTMSKDGTVAIAGTFPTDDGKLLAYAVAEAGSDWNVMNVRDVATGKDLSDKLRWVKFSGASWTKDNKGFYYSRFNEPSQDKEQLKEVNQFQKVFYHVIGTQQDADTLVYERPDHAQWTFGGGVSDDGRWLILGVEAGDTVNNALFYKDLSGATSVNDGRFVELFNAFDAKYDFIGNDGTTFYVRSDLDAPRGRVWAIDVTKPERANWRELVPQSSDALTSASIVGDRVFCNYLHDARSLVKVYDTKGKLIGDVPLPGICTASGFAGKRSDTETFFATSGYTLPPSIWRYDLKTGATEVIRAPKVPFEPSKYETKQVFATSKDGTKVPMFITHKKGIALDGSHPTLLYGYGGFNISITPDYSPVQAAWLEMGGVYVEGNLRGGGEYGEEWHRGAMRTTKQHTFDDCIACGEWLIKNGYTTKAKLGLQGGSNGGLLVGACETQRPDLWGACLPAVGVMDMLRFQKFTIGWAWVGDYGSSENSEEFKALYSFSPYHNIKQGVCYPPTLVTTGDHDDRVYPAHSFKFAAAMQEAQGKVSGCNNPILIRIEKRAGHGAGKPTSKRIEEAADIYAFLAQTFGMEVR